MERRRRMVFVRIDTDMVARKKTALTLNSVHRKSAWVVIFIISGLFQSLTVTAQDSYGSPYNSLGIGNLYNRGYGATDMLGNTAIGYQSFESVNLKNPASYNSIIGYNHIFDMGLELNFASFEQKNQTQQLSYGNLSHLNLWFRLNKRWSSVVGLRPFSALEYDITEVVSDNNFGRYEVNYEGTGGLNEIYWGHSIQLIKNLSVGVNASFIFGQLDKTETAIQIANVGSIQTNTNETLRKGTLEFGAQYSAKIKKSKLTIGLVWKPNTSMATTFERHLAVNGGDSISTDGFSSYNIPENLGLGISFTKGRYTFLTDIEKTKWSVNEPGENFKYRDVMTYSFGIERSPDFQSESFFDHITLRTGVSINNFYVDINNTSFSEFKWSLGVGLPIRRNTSQINLGYNYTRRGTTINNLIQENYHSITIGFAFKKRWFQKSYYN